MLGTETPVKQRHARNMPDLEEELKCTRANFSDWELTQNECASNANCIYEGRCPFIEGISK